MLELAKSDLPEPGGVSDLSSLGAWYVNMFVIDRRKSMIIMNEKTLLSFILFGAKKSNTKKDLFPDMCLNGIVQLLQLENFPAQSIAKVVEESSISCYAKTDSKTVLGNMNDLVYLYGRAIMYEGGLSACNLHDIIRSMNRMPQRNLEWQYSIEAARKMLGVNAP